MGHQNKTAVYFHYQQPLRFANRTAIKNTVVKIFTDYTTPLQRLDYIFCSDDYLLAINQQFLNHHDYTDIITFPLQQKGKPIVGEIYISRDRVKENARIHKVSFDEELQRVIFHGALHLCGLRDKNKKQKSAMRLAEQHYLNVVSRETPL